MSQVLQQLYSELKASKPAIYKAFSCDANVTHFVEHLEIKNDIDKTILNNFYRVFFYNHGNGYSLYGNMSFDFHINLLYFDKISSDWYVFDYDIEKIIEGCELENPILYSEFLRQAFRTYTAKFQIQTAIKENNYYPLQSFQQIMIFTLPEYKKIEQENASLLHKLRFISLEPDEKEKNFLWKLCSDHTIAFNNLYEFIGFLSEKKPLLGLLRDFYRHKLFEQIFVEGFANAKYRLDKKKLCSLEDFFFGTPANSFECIQEEAKNDKALATISAQSRFFTRVPKTENSVSTENCLIFK